MKKGFCLVSILIFAAACKTAPSAERTPSSVKASSYLKPVQRCGTVEYSESNYYALDSEDSVYSVSLDCNQDNRVNKADGQVAINIPESQLGPANTQWLKDYKKHTVKKTKRARRNPYVCVQVMAASDPCLSKRNTIGFNPEFSLKK